MKNRLLLNAICIIVLLLLLVTPVSANSAQWYWRGVTSSGAFVTEGESPIVVEKELLTFNLPEFPQPYYQDEAFIEYKGSVTAEYTFYNPSDMTVTATLAFPFGALPDYAYGNNDSDLEKYGVLLGGEQINTTIRHSLSLSSLSSNSFDFNSELPPLYDGYLSHGNYSPETKVTLYKWSLKKNEFGFNTQTTLALDISPEQDGRAFYLVGQSLAHTQKDGDFRIGKWASNGDVALYVFGEPLAEIPEIKFYENGATEDGKEVEAMCEYTGSSKMTLLEFALQSYTEESGILKQDWYNAVLTEIVTNSKSNKYNVLDLSGYEKNYSGRLSRCYQYEITLAPGERKTNTVCAPIYPSIDMSYTSAVYEYTYLLSPAGSWADFGALTININTPYYLTDSSVEGFNKTDEGYSISLDGLPKDSNGKYKELIFSLSTEENPIPKSKTPEGILKSIIYFLIFFCPTIVIGLAVIAIIIFIIKRLFRR